MASGTAVSPMPPTITLSGAPFEKGLAHGRAFADKVARSLDTYAHLFRRRRELSWDDARAIARRFAPVFTGDAAPLADEMRGIAEGAGRTFEDILALNLRTEILYSAHGDPAACARGGECTAFAAVPPATAGGAVLAGQTWDYAIAQREATFFARVPAEGGAPAMLLVLEAGMVGGKGVNGAGLCLTLNALSCPRAAVGLPLHARMRRILEAPTMDEALRRGRAGGIPAPAALTITAADGRCVCLELDPAGAEELRPQGGVFAHTNHFIGPSAAARRSYEPSGSTLQRLLRMEALLRSKPGLSPADAEGFLADHGGEGWTICVHPRPVAPPDPPSAASATNYGFVADLAARRFRFAMGNPCEGAFVDLPWPHG